MIDPTPNETAAMVEGGKAGGAYLDNLGRTDLAQLTEEEWDTFVEVIVTGYCDHLRDLEAQVSTSTETGPPIGAEKGPPPDGWGKRA